MAKVTAPLLSMGAKGQIGKAMVIANWRGIDYARQYVKPANPRTTAQQKNRTRFALLREMWKLAPGAVRKPWEAFAQGRPFLPFNKFVGENNRLLSGVDDFTPAIVSPGARGGLPPESIDVEAGAAAGEVAVTVNVTEQLPDGWTIAAVGGAAFPQQDPSLLFRGPFRGTEEADPATQIVLAGFEPGEAVMVFGWVVYNKPDGSLAYSVSLGEEVAATA